MTSPLARGEAMQEVENIVRFMEMLKAIGAISSWRSRWTWRKPHRSWAT